jgi:proline dehydrogenase
MSFFNALIVRTLPFIPKPIVGYFAARYIAGEKLEDGIRVVRDFNEKGILATMDVLGEGVTSREESLEMRRQCEEVLHAIHRNNLRATLSLKPTQMGLAFAKNFCLENIGFLCHLAREYSTSVCIDMEDHPYTDATFEIYDTLRATHDNVTCVIQAYLKRSAEDIRMLTTKPTSLRLCKGIYVEPEEIAYKEREHVRENYKALMNQLLDAGAFCAIATHDDPLIEEGYRQVRERKLTPERYEFQMLLGVREQKRDEIHRNGHPIRIYVPFGKQWYAYSTRRLKENPQMAGYIVKSILGLDRYK